jgi:hypothetical protein
MRNVRIDRMLSELDNFSWPATLFTAVGIFLAVIVAALSS